LIIAIVFGVRAVRALRDPVERERWKRWFERQGERPLLRPVASVVRWLYRVVLKPLWIVIGPPLRFAWKRLTPGELGIELTTLVSASILTEVAVQAIKHGVERARPADGIVHAGGFAYPSGHAAVSIIYLAIAVLFARSASTPAARVTWLIGGVLTAVAIGLSR